MQKLSAYPPPRKKSLLSRMMPYAAGGAGLAGLGYLGYKGLAPKPTSTPLPEPKLNLNNRSILKGLHGLFNTNSLPDQPETTADKVTNWVVDKDAKIGMGAIGAQLANGVSRGSLFSKLPWLQKGIGTAAKVSPAVLAASNIVNAAQSNDNSMAGKGTEIAGNFGSLLTGGQSVMLPVHMGLWGSEATRNAQYHKTSTLTDALYDAYARMRSNRPEIAAEGREAANYFLNNPTINKNWVEPVINPSLANQMAQRNFGMPGASLTRGFLTTGFGAAPADPQRDEVLNTAPLQHLIQKMRRELAVNGVQ